jgi:YVTN family beta-propeller protein
MTNARRLLRDRTFTSKTALLMACSVAMAGGVFAGCGDEEPKGGGGSSGSGASAGTTSGDGSAGTAGSAGYPGTGGSAGYAGTAGSAGSSGATGGSAGYAGTAGDAGPPEVLNRSSRSSAIAISDDDAWIVETNLDDRSISIFDAAREILTARVPVGREPSSVVIHPNGKSAFVSLRADAAVVRVDGIDGPSPVVSHPVNVGSEPTGIALSPTGRTLFVAEHAEGRITLIDTASMTVTGTIDGVDHPFALAVTNDLDADDSDELLVAPEFYGEPNQAVEGADDSRSGRVRVFKLADKSELASIALAPRDSGFSDVPGNPTVKTSPNQLASVTIQGGKAYVTSISASPAAPLKFNVNVQPVVYVVDLAAKAEDTSNIGTANLARVVKDAVGNAPMFFMADLADVAFIGDSNVAYFLSRGADLVQRIVYDAAKGIQVGSDFNKQIDVNGAAPGSYAGCLTPIGITTAHNGPRAYLNCWLSRSLGIVDLSKQALKTSVESAPAPSADPEKSIARGQRFFYTGRGRWSDNGWSSCASCHPGGLSDNVTWRFAAGPRQSTSLDGSFSHGAGPQKQRIFNWTAIFEEVHDFERNTRDVSGGLGAITTSATNECGKLAAEKRDPEVLPGGLAGPLKELQDRPQNCTKDWDDIEAYMKSIRPPRGLRTLDAGSVARGSKLFGMPTASENNGGCVSCHGGAGWTVSRRFWLPTTATNAALTTAPFARPTAWPASFNLHSFQIANQPAAADNGVEQAPPQVACVIRNLGTFGVPGDATKTGVLEVRTTGARAQGAGGYNVPALYGLSLGAPYLHHGQARTLDELFDDPKWQSHLLAANPVFLTTGDKQQQKRDLVAFLLSIDAATTEQALPYGFDGCPQVFP